MKIQDRIKELRRVPARELVHNPKNWRTHPDSQRKALNGVLAEIGYADALLARELPDGTLQLIDGHLRAETTPDQNVPVLILDLDEKEADLLLAVLDPLSAMAGANDALLATMVDNIDTNNAALNDMLNHLTATSILDELPDGSEATPNVTIPELYQIIIDCENEEEQKELFERLVKEGKTCKIANL